MKLIDKVNEINKEIDALTLFLNQLAKDRQMSYTALDLAMIHIAACKEILNEKMVALTSKL